MRTLPNEPVALAGVIAGVVGALMVMAVSLGWINLSQEQQTNILGFVVLVAPIVASFFARSQVTPVASPQAMNTDGDVVRLAPADGSVLPR